MCWCSTSPWGFRQFSHHFEAIADALRAGDAGHRAARAVGNWLSAQHRPPEDRGNRPPVHRAGHPRRAPPRACAACAVRPAARGRPARCIYRLTERLSWAWARRENIEFGAFGRFARRMYEWLDWVPGAHDRRHLRHRRRFRGCRALLAYPGGQSGRNRRRASCCPVAPARSGVRARRAPVRAGRGGRPTGARHGQMTPTLISCKARSAWSGAHLCFALILLGLLTLAGYIGN
jgi:adenosylcobinamide-phosphate synthase